MKTKLAATLAVAAALVAGSLLVAHAQQAKSSSSGDPRLDKIIQQNEKLLQQNDQILQGQDDIKKTLKELQEGILQVRRRTS